jgi:hypothetical protein
MLEDIMIPDAESRTSIDRNSDEVDTQLQEPYNEPRIK